MRLFQSVLYGLGKFVLFNGKQRRFRKGVMLFLANAFVVLGVLFSLELVIVLLGVGDITIPLTQPAQEFLSRILY